jgi:hypothetical protein
VVVVSIKTGSEPLYIDSGGICGAKDPLIARNGSKIEYNREFLFSEILSLK